MYQPVFNEAHLPDKVNVQLRGDAKVTPLVTNIVYNAWTTLTRKLQGAYDVYMLAYAGTYARERRMVRTETVNDP